MNKTRKINEFTAVIPARSLNESFARAVVAAFAASLDPTVEELCDLRTAVSEAVTNSIVHAYRNEKEERKRKIWLRAESFEGGLVRITVKDRGCGIENVEQAMRPLYSGAPEEERSGMGFSVMACFTDKLQVKSAVGKGTTVVLSKYIGEKA